MKIKVAVIGKLHEVMFTVEFNDNILSYLSPKIRCGSKFEGYRYEMAIETFLEVVKDMQE
jgi:hypothetical protein